MLLNKLVRVGRRDHVYGVRGHVLPMPRSSRGNADVSRNELRRGRRKRGPYDLPALFYQKASSYPSRRMIAKRTR